MATPNEDAARRTRYYRVSARPDAAVRGIVTDKLIRADRKTQAMAKVARDMFSVRVASQDDMAELLLRGVRIEDAEVAHAPNGDDPDE